MDLAAWLEQSEEFREDSTGILNVLQDAETQHAVKRGG
jgi:hypothetical protein